MRRREFISIVGSAAAWPLAARAQQSAMPVIGYLGLETPERYGSRLRAFREGLASTGFEQGRNVAIEFRWAGGHNDLLPTLVADLVGRPVNVIIAPGGIQGAVAAKAVTSTMPIVFEMGADPVALGLVSNLNHPGGNITGATSLNSVVNPKRLEQLAAAAVRYSLPTSAWPTAAPQYWQVRSSSFPICTSFGLLGLRF
jgi:ABC-type uncharacterized transport system substrate-binding protein